MKINELRIEIGHKVINEKRLNELFQMEQAVPWEWTDRNLIYPIEAHFSVDGIDYIAGFYPSPLGDSDDAWITGFAVDKGEEHGTDIFSRFEDGMFDSKGNQIKVFRTVMDIIANFVRGRGPDELHIGATPERERVYSKLLKKFEPQIEQGGYRISSPEYVMFPPYGRVVIFSLEKKNVNEAISINPSGIEWEDEARAIIKAGDSEIVVHFAGKDNVFVVFTREDDLPVNAFEVFSKVLGAIIQFVSREKPSKIRFLAYGKRASIYVRLLKQLKRTIDELGYSIKVERFHSGDAASFELIKRGASE